MDKIEKALTRLTEKERGLIKSILLRVSTGDMQELDNKKLKGKNDIFRVRKGNIRIIYRKGTVDIFILSIERRNEKTYK